MKKLLLAITAVSFSLTMAHAQLVNTTSTQTHDPSFTMGRDFWLALPSNLWGKDSGGTYINIYITSSKNTIAYVEGLPLSKTSVQITADSISTFQVPEFLEMESSGIIENKGIHVFDTDADLSVYFISHQPYDGEGSYIIPTIGWGTDYVVAAYGSYFDGTSTEYDLPSECTIVVDRDSTTVDITPTCDCRQCTSGNINGNGDAQIVIYPAGVVESFTLNHGQSLQLMPVKAQDPDNFDMSGMIIHSNVPIGVIGASMEPNIPADFPYPNFVCEMIPPVRTWGETYYATNYEQPPGQPGHGYARYLFISSMPGQVIYRNDCLTGEHVECIIANQYGIYWDELETGQKLFSDAPFLCVSYINSATYPSNVKGDGDPAEVVINSREQFTKTVTFQDAEDPSDSIVPYTNYVNITFNIKDAQKTFFDGSPIANQVTQCLDDTFAIFNVQKIAPGIHTVTSDSGVGVYLYGYGNDESYAWSSASFEGTFHSPDTVAPKVNIQMECYQAFVHVTDSGFLLNDLYEQSGLAAIWPDTSYNMTYQPDGNWIEGSGSDTSGYEMSVIDPTKPGILIVSLYDFASNSTTITSSYTPIAIKMEPPLQNLGMQIIGGSPNVAYDTLYNEGQAPFTIDQLHLKDGTVGFSLFDSIGGTLDLSPIPPAGNRLIQIQFTSKQTTQVVDSIIFGNECASMSAALIGSGVSSIVSASVPEIFLATLQSSNGRYIQVLLPADWLPPIHVELNNVLGIPMFEGSISSLPPSFDPGPLPHGVYFYHLTSGPMSQSGKVILGE
jgi:IgGFc binding protein